MIDSLYHHLWVYDDEGHKRHRGAFSRKWNQDEQVIYLTFIKDDQNEWYNEGWDLWVRHNVTDAEAFIRHWVKFYTEVGTEISVTKVNIIANDDNAFVEIHYTHK